jgi:glutamate synthase (NADPH/NADH) small chain
MGFAEIKLLKTEELSQLMVERGITDSDVQEVIDTAENGGTKLYQEGATHCLAKKRLGQFTVYAEYEIEANGYQLLNVYSHRVMLEEDAG